MIHDYDYSHGYIHKWVYCGVIEFHEEILKIIKVSLK